MYLEAGKHDQLEINTAVHKTYIIQHRESWSTEQEGEGQNLHSIKGREAGIPTVMGHFSTSCGQPMVSTSWSTSIQTDMFTCNKIHMCTHLSDGVWLYTLTWHSLIACCTSSSAPRPQGSTGSPALKSRLFFLFRMEVHRREVLLELPAGLQTPLLLSVRGVHSVYSGRPQ